ncbi:Uncharacterised protein [Salmonella enterica subsp. enterica serovar Typhimurium str. DT104]|nr:Uncharacterised protein [Salmonella enterica subsp. enterica serovar Typhimurium str. DT104]
MAPVVGLRRVRTGDHGKDDRQRRARYAVVFYRRRQRRFKARAAVLADIQRQCAVGARGGVIVSAAATPVAVVYLYIRRRRAIHLLIRAPDAVAARKDNRRVGGRVALGIPRGDDDRDGLADFRFGESVAVVIHRRSERYLRRRRMGVLQADKIELFIPQ